MRDRSSARERRLARARRADKAYAARGGVLPASSGAPAFGRAYVCEASRGVKRCNNPPRRVTTQEKSAKPPPWPRDERKEHVKEPT